jgi:putative component of membrane protein insertase Oxa1/YidC/SpoIIIJ protein YidD
MKFVASAFLVFTTLLVSAQNSDLALLQQRDFRLMHPEVYAMRKVVFMEVKSERFLHRINPIRLFLGLAMFGYQRIVSPQFAAGCIYEPSCSHFSKLAIREFGLIKGIVLTADRLTRCDRLSALTNHPVDRNLQTGKFTDFPSDYVLQPR